MKIKITDPAIAEVNMTPMIDIVFQLIAFFMVITNFEQTQADERVKLPKDAIARPTEKPREDALVINIGFDPDKAKGDGSNVVVFYAGDKVPAGEFIPPDNDLDARRRSRLHQEARIYRRKGKNPKQITVEIRADGAVPTGLVQEFIKLAQEAEFEKFALKAKQEEF